MLKIGKRFAVSIISELLSHPNYDDNLALFEADTDGGGQGVFRCLVCGDDLQQLHLVHRGEVVHADHLHGHISNKSINNTEILIVLKMTLAYTKSNKL